MRLRYFALILIGIAIRLILAYYPYGNFDQVVWDTVALIVRAGGNLYAEFEYYCYSPVWSFFLSGFSHIPLPLHFTVRTFLTLVDVIICLLIYKITRKDTYAALYMINPVSILITGFHGQLDNFAVLPILFGVYLYRKQPNGWWFFLLGTLSLLIKHTTFFTVLVLFYGLARTKTKFVLMTLGAVSLFLLSFLPYMPSGRENIINNAFLNSVLHGFYGIKSFFNDWSTIPFALCMFVMIILLRNRPLTEQLLASTLTFLTFTPVIGEQYFVLPLIFGAIQPSAGYFLYSLAASIFLLGSSNNLNLPIPSIWNSVWICAIFWLVSISLPRTILIDLKSKMISLVKQPFRRATVNLSERIRGK